MITLLLGSDRLSKKEYIANLAKQSNAEIESFSESDSLQNLNSLFEQQLFGAPKIVVLDGCWKNIETEELLSTLGENKSAQLIILEESLDKRKKANSEFLKDKRVKVAEFNSPVGFQESAQWIIDYSKEQNITIEQDGAKALARALLADEDSALNVNRAKNELLKLQAFADRKTITSEMVEELTENISGVDVFALLNAIATKNKKLAVQMLDEYFATETADEKTNAIKVVALLSDQLRSLLIAFDGVNRNLPDSKILDMTGWKSGRLFMMKKLARNFSAKQLQLALAKLGNLDRELKTGSMPPHVVLDLIIADM